MEKLNMALFPLGGEIGGTKRGATIAASKVSKLWKTPEKIVEPFIQSPRLGPSGPGAPKTAIDDVWGDLPSYDAIKYVPTLNQRIHSSLSKKGILGNALSSVISTIQKPFYDAKFFKQALINPLKSAWKYGDPTKKEGYTISTKAGYGISNSLAPIVDRIAKTLNASRSVKGDTRSFENLPYLKKKMLGENWSDISYKNMFKNIAIDAKNAIHSKYKQTTSNLIDSMFGVIGKETSGNAIRRGIGLARIYKDNPEYVSHYLKQALVDSIPGGAGAALQIIRGVHRSVEPINTFKSALERVLAARLGEGKNPTSAFGPGVYSAVDKFQADRTFRSFGDFAYKGTLTPRAILKVLMSKGFITPQKLDKIGPKLGFPGTRIEGMNSNIDHPFMQALIKAGYLGYRHGDAFTNWAMGEMPGMGLKLIEKSKPLEIIIDGIKHVNGYLDGTYPEILRKANGGYIGVPKFENGINSVPVDMLAQLHKNEAVIPANMNPFNPNANNATMSGTVYNVGNVTMQFAEAPANGRALFAEFKEAIRIDNAKVGGIKEFGSKVMSS
jgi:hypothetical protein